jgi:hypothetical protein
MGAVFGSAATVTTPEPGWCGASPLQTCALDRASLRQAVRQEKNVANASVATNFSAVAH